MNQFQVDFTHVCNFKKRKYRIVLKYRMQFILNRGVEGLINRRTF